MPSSSPGGGGGGGGNGGNSDNSTITGHKKAGKKAAVRARKRGPSLDIDAIAKGKYDVRSAVQGDADANSILSAAIERARKQGSALDLKIKQRAAEAGRMRMKLADFARNGAALGVALSSSAKPREPSAVPEISMRPIFDTGNRLADHSKKIDREKRQLEQAKIYLDVVRQLLVRTRAEMLVEDKRQTSAEEATRLEKLKLFELRAKERTGMEKIRAARKQLNTMQRRGHEKLKSWHEEVASVHAQRLERMHRDSILTKQISRKNQVERDVASMNAQEVEAARKKLQGAHLHGDGSGNKGGGKGGIGDAMDKILHEEQRFEHVFRLVGVKMGEMNPNAIIARTLNQSVQARQLDCQLADSEQNLKRLRAQLEQEEQAYNDTLFKGENDIASEVRTRMANIAVLEKQLELGRQDNARAMSVLRPMRQFVHALATKVLGPEDAQELDLESDGKAVACLQRCGDVLKSTKKHGGAGGLDLGQVLLQRKKQTHAVKTNGKVGVPGVTDVPDHWKNAEAVVSPYNFRLRRKLEDMKATDLTYASAAQAQDSDKQNVAAEDKDDNTAATSLKERRAQNRAKALDDAQHLQLEKSLRGQTLTRLSVKAQSQKIIHNATKPKKKSRKTLQAESIARLSAASESEVNSW
jgi:hypothetical protein